jgi:hypothetical protein
MICSIGANSRLPLAVQQLRNWNGGTVFASSLVGGFRVVRFDLGFEGGSAFWSAASRITRWRCLFRISSPPVLLSPIPLRPDLPVAALGPAPLPTPVKRFSPSGLLRQRASGDGTGPKDLPGHQHVVADTFISDPMEPGSILHSLNSCASKARFAPPG